jgi:hypothetical protein
MQSIRTATIAMGVVLALPCAGAGELEVTDEELQQAESTIRRYEKARVDRLLNDEEGVGDRSPARRKLDSIIGKEASISRHVRLNAGYAVFHAAEEAERNSSRRLEFVEILTERLNDPVDIIASTAMKDLLKLREGDFNARAIEIIQKEMDRKLYAGIILLAGIASPDYCLEKTKGLLPVAGVNQKQAWEEAGEPLYGLNFPARVWAAMMVAARHGDKKALQMLMADVKDREDKAHTAT